MTLLSISSTKNESFHYCVYNVIYNSDFACYIDVLIKLFGYSGFQDWCDLKTIPHLPNPTQIPFSTNMTDCVV